MTNGFPYTMKAPQGPMAERWQDIIERALYPKHPNRPHGWLRRYLTGLTKEK